MLSGLHDSSKPKTNRLIPFLRMGTLKLINSPTFQPPLSPVGGSSTLVVEGYADADGTNAVEVRWQSVSPSYFRTLSIPIRHGRSFDETDREGGRRVAIVNETMARMYWAESDVVGKRFRSQSSEDSWVDIVGVAASTKVRTVSESEVALFYRPISQIRRRALHRCRARHDAREHDDRTYAAHASQSRHQSSGARRQHHVGSHR